eukprot:7632592-Pyramimonas_sp.AAC.1
MLQADVDEEEVGSAEPPRKFARQGVHGQREMRHGPVDMGDMMQWPVHGLRSLREFCDAHGKSFQATIAAMSKFTIVLATAYSGMGTPE